MRFETFLNWNTHIYKALRTPKISSKSKISSPHVVGSLEESLSSFADYYILSYGSHENMGAICKQIRHIQ